MKSICTILLNIITLEIIWFKALKNFYQREYELITPHHKSAIRSGNKRIFIDPSIAVAALNANPESMENDLKTFGFIFENTCIHDLSVYKNSHGGKVSYYHDKSDLKIDCVVHLRDGRYALIECKLGSERIEEGAQNLLKINRLIEKNEKLDNPTFLAVLTGGKMLTLIQTVLKSFQSVV